MKRLSEDKGGWNTDENGDRMDEEWFLKGEREREREYVCRASARVRLFRVYRVSSESPILIARYRYDL